jgi:DNA-binding NtrC family response regulator
MKKLLVISKQADVISGLQEAVEPDYQVESVPDSTEATLAAISYQTYELIFVDILELIALVSEPRVANFKPVISPIRANWPSVEIAILTDFDHLRETVRAIRGGATDYITLPIIPDEVGQLLEDVKESNQLQAELDYLRGAFWQQDDLRLIRTNCAEMQAVFEKVRSVANKKVTVLLTGETGTGKGVIARLIHRHSRRKADQFIAVHCGAIPDTLLESELFGHEKGAYTGAIARKQGRFELAEGGTIFLDEIGTISPSMQIKLLQVLQDRTVQRLGSEKEIKVDVRVIAATNDDLNQRRKDATFRSDLFYRLNVFPIELPPLRRRRDDIPILVETFLNRLNMLYNKEISYIHNQVLTGLMNYDWPGNIRELENLVERAYLLEESDTLTPDAFPSDLFADESPSAEVPLDTSQTLADFRAQAFAVLERQYLHEILSEYAGRIDLSAKAAGISPRQLHRLMTRYELDKQHFKQGFEKPEHRRPKHKL